ncbi:SGNH hydrolase [Thozetella sp. PMI_491]|nr:SGNH hydrolase [Thozetella sp. PMI_491]
MEPDEQTTRLLDANENEDLNDEPEAARHPKSWLGDEETALSPRHDSKWPKISALVAVGVLVGAIFATVGYFIGISAGRTSTATHAGPYRILVVGDSISEGWEGAYTWRYRLWQWFRDNHVDTVFLGPYNGTAPAPSDLSSPVWITMSEPVTRSYDPPLEKVNGGYALDIDPAFLESGSAHFAFWGRAAWQVEEMIAEQIRKYRPDYVLVELGFNDLGWTSTVPKTIISMGHLIANARAVEPKLRFAISNVPQRTQIEDGLPEDTREYNDKLRKEIAGWSTSESPVELVEFEEVYSCGLAGCPSGYDGLHPNYRGEFELAYAFTKTLHEKYGLGHQPLVLPATYPDRVCNPPSSAHAYPASNGTKFTWDAVYGAFGYEAQLRQIGTEWATDTVNYTQSLQYEATWATDSAPALWELRVRTYCEMSVKSAWLNAVPGNTTSEGV